MSDPELQDNVVIFKVTVDSELLVVITGKVFNMRHDKVALSALTFKLIIVFEPQEISLNREEGKLHQSSPPKKQ